MLFRSGSSICIASLLCGRLSTSGQRVLRQISLEAVDPLQLYFFAELHYPRSPFCCHLSRMQAFLPLLCPTYIFHPGPIVLRHAPSFTRRAHLFAALCALFHWPLQSLSNKCASPWTCFCCRLQPGIADVLPLQAEVSQSVYESVSIHR